MDVDSRMDLYAARRGAIVRAQELAQREMLAALMARTRLVQSAGMGVGDPIAPQAHSRTMDVLDPIHNPQQSSTIPLSLSQRAGLTHVSNIQHQPLYHQHQTSQQPNPTNNTSHIDYEFQLRRSAARDVLPGYAAQQVLASPVDAWGLQHILLKIRGTAVAGPDPDPSARPVPVGEIRPASATPSTPRSHIDRLSEHDEPTRANTNRHSFTSEESTAPTFDYFSSSQEDLPPMTPTTPPVPTACIVRISGARRTPQDVALLAAQLSTLIRNAPTVRAAAFTPCEPLDSRAPDLGAFEPSSRDVALKLLFSGAGGDAFAHAATLLQPLGGCILIKPLADFVIERDDEPIMPTVPTSARPPRMRGDANGGFQRLVRKLQLPIPPQDPAFAVDPRWNDKRFLVQDSRTRAQWAQPAKSGKFDRDLARQLRSVGLSS